jgi:hypothetical protein
MSLSMFDFSDSATLMQGAMIHPGAICMVIVIPIPIQDTMRALGRQAL